VPTVQEAEWFLQTVLEWYGKSSLHRGLNLWPSSP
jgi:hypothetical protein